MKQSRFFVSPLSLLLTAILLVAGPTQAQRDDDDILSPADDDALFPQTGPEKVKELGIKIGFFPLVGLGDADSKLGKEINNGIRQELRGIGVDTYKLRLPAAKRSKRVGNVSMGTHKTKLKAAQNFLRRGKNSLKKLRFKSANKSFRSAVKHFEAGVGALNSTDDVVTAYLGLAEAAARQGVETKTIKYLRKVAAIAPELKMDSSIYPPPFIRTFQSARYDLFKEGFGSLLIDESAGGAEVMIDGQVMGTAPLRVSGLPFGKHFVKVTSLRGTFAKVIELGDSEMTLSPQLLGGAASGPVDEMANNKLTPAGIKKLGRIIQQSSLDYGVVGVFAVQGNEVPTSLMIINPKGGEVIRVPKLAFDGDLLNLSIESVTVLNAIQDLKSAPNFSPIGDRPLLRGFSSEGSFELSEKKLRYRAKKPRRRLARGGDSSGGTPRRGSLADDDGGRIIEGGGSSGGRRSSLLDEEEDTFGRETRRNILDESKPKPITEEPWFWPTVIGGGSVIGVVGLSSALIGLGVVPSPFPKDSVAVEVTFP